jgi:DNA primase large subunit
VFDKLEHDELEECMADLKEKLEEDFSREIVEIIKQIIYSRVGTLVDNWQSECKVEFSPECIKEIIMRVQN